MVAIPTVKSFCGCCNLKVSCIVIASFRMVVSVIVFLLMFIRIFISLYESDQKPTKKNNGEFPTIEFIIFMYVFIQYLAVFINVFASYNFILGATSDNPPKMKCYILIEGINIVLYLLLIPSWLPYSLIVVVFAAIECYILICSNSLYQECLNSSQVRAVNPTEFTVIRYNNVPITPPPLYESCVNETTLYQNTEIEH